MTTILNNLTILRDAVAAQPEDLFDLNSYKTEEPCGTLFCTAGLATTMPYFQDLGVSMRQWSLNGFYVQVKGDDIDDTEETNKLFGENAFRHLFAGADNGAWDKALGYVETYGAESDAYVPQMSHKTLALARLDKQIAIYAAAVAA